MTLIDPQNPLSQMWLDILSNDETILERGLPGYVEFSCRIEDVNYVYDKYSLGASAS